MRRLAGRLYLLVIRRAIRRIDVSAATVEKVTGDILAVIDEFWCPTIKNHVVGDPVGDGNQRARRAVPDRQP